MTAPANRRKTGGQSRVPNNEATRFQPGVSPNPSGRPKDRMRPALRARLTEEDIEIIVDGAIRDAKSDDPDVAQKARAWLFEQVDGKLVEKRENGEAGAFDTLDHLPDEDMRKLLSVIRDRPAKRSRAS